MKISPIINILNSKQVSFTAGKVDAYFDFDHTYCPESHADLKKITPESCPRFSKYCNNFRKFIDNTRDGFTFNLTTGRTLGEYDAVSHLIKMKGFELPLPDTVIAKNGSDQYIRRVSRETGRLVTDEDFYKRGKFPFAQDITNTQKEEDIKALTGWDGAKIKAKLREIFKEHDLRIVEADSENSVGDYGPRSLFSSGKLLDERKRVFSGTDKPDWSVGLRNDGNCKVFITYPLDMTSNQERKSVYYSIGKKINNFFESIGVKKTYSYIGQYDDKCYGRPYIVYEPLVDERLKWCGFKKDSGGLTKLYDTKEAVKKAIKNNDLVIAAGDSSNDLPMLNPALYVDFNPDVFPELEKWQSDIHGLRNAVKQDPKKYAEIQKQIDELPFISIYVREKGKLGMPVRIPDVDLKYINSISVETGHLEDGVREAIKIHAQRNPEYMAKLSPDLKKEIFGIVDDITEPIATGIKKKPQLLEVLKKHKAAAFAVLAVSTAALTTLLLIKNNKNKKAQIAAAQKIQNSYVPIKINNPPQIFQKFINVK